MLTPKETTERRMLIQVRRALLLAADAINKYVDTSLNPSEVTDIKLEEEEEE